jgi:plasmid stabilization system protein ParE
MAQVVLTAEAERDLDRITQFLVESEPASVLEVVEAILQALYTLVRHPLIGRRAEGEVRELVISRGATGYVALYRYEPVRDTIRILRLRHQRECGFSD